MIAARWRISLKQRDGRHIGTGAKNLEYFTAFEPKGQSYSAQFGEDPGLYKPIKVLLLCSFILAAIGWLSSSGSSHSAQTKTTYKSED